LAILASIIFLWYSTCTCSLLLFLSARSSPSVPPVAGLFQGCCSTCAIRSMLDVSDISSRVPSCCPCSLALCRRGWWWDAAEPSLALCSRGQWWDAAEPTLALYTRGRWWGAAEPRYPFWSSSRACIRTWCVCCSAVKGSGRRGGRGRRRRGPRLVGCVVGKWGRRGQGSAAVICGVARWSTGRWERRRRGERLLSGRCVPLLPSLNSLLSHGLPPALSLGPPRSAAALLLLLLLLLQLLLMLLLLQLLPQQHLLLLLLLLLLPLLLFPLLPLPLLIALAISLGCRWRSQLHIRVQVCILCRPCERWRERHGSGACAERGRSGRRPRQRLHGWGPRQGVQVGGWAWRWTRQHLLLRLVGLVSLRCGGQVGCACVRRLTPRCGCSSSAHAAKREEGRWRRDRGGRVLGMLLWSPQGCTER